MNHELKAGAEPVAGYKLIKQLGRGGFGEVWKASGPGGFLVALKFIPLAEKVGNSNLRELEVLKSIRHPHLLGGFSSWQEPGRLIIGMELADGTLMDRLNELVGQGFTGIPSPEIFKHFGDAAEALDYLNEPRHAGGKGGNGPQGIQHRDVKPHNLLLVGGRVKVADFGLARVLENTSTGHTGSLTMAYAAPEFFDQKTSSQSDQYSLAITYCHLRGGRLPFEGSHMAMMAGHLHREPDLSMIPEAERGVVARALSKSPRDRWPSCRAFVHAVMNPDSAEASLTVAPSTSNWMKPTEADPSRTTVKERDTPSDPGRADSKPRPTPPIHKPKDQSRSTWSGFRKPAGPMDGDKNPFTSFRVPGGAYGVGLCAFVLLSLAIVFVFLANTGTNKTTAQEPNPQPVVTTKVSPQNPDPPVFEVGSRVRLKSSTSGYADAVSGPLDKGVIIETGRTGVLLEIPKDGSRCLVLLDSPGQRKLWVMTSTLEILPESAPDSEPNP